MNQPLSRRAALTTIAAGTLTTLGACSRRDPASGEVVLYSSVDDFVLRDVVRAFEAASTVRVRLLGDTEATKTTGLVERLVAERSRPRADVWWSSEPFGTIRLTAMGVFEPTEIAAPPIDDPALAGRLSAPDRSWHGLALRARVIAVRAGRFESAPPPDRLRDLSAPSLRARVGIARPRFGTTRGHMAAIAAQHGEHALRDWLLALRENGLRVYDGNSTVVRAIAEGELDAGLTDTDDAWAARRNQWPVEAVFEKPDPSPPASGLPSPGPMLIPNTVALVRNGPNPANARRLLEFLLAGPAEEILALSDSHNIPVRHGSFPGLEPYRIPNGWLPDLHAVAEADAPAMAVCDEVLG
ncbi:MAG TPA: extracellular solute-binding protein [Phycisphaerales bacterium]|nr:extracellular solute-binding protein [Phycisphaerales bacterium]